MFKHLLIVGCLADQQVNICVRKVNKNRKCWHDLFTKVLVRSKGGFESASQHDGANCMAISAIFGRFLAISANFGRFWPILTFRLVGPPAGSLNVDQQLLINECCGCHQFSKCWTFGMLWLPSTLQVLNICCLFIASLTLEAIGWTISWTLT